MPNTIAAPDEADALRRMAKVMNRVHFPATLLHLLLALLALLTGNKSLLARIALPGTTGRTWRTPRSDWQFSPSGETLDDLAPVLHPRALRRLRRQRAWLGWIMRGLPGRGMRRSGIRAPRPCPARTARAPPQPAPVPQHHESVRKTPPRAATTHAQTPPAPRRAGVSPPSPPTATTPESPAPSPTPGHPEATASLP